MNFAAVLLLGINDGDHVEVVFDDLERVIGIVEKFGEDGLVVSQPLGDKTLLTAIDWAKVKLVIKITPP